MFAKMPPETLSVRKRHVALVTHMWLFAHMGQKVLSEITRSRKALGTQVTGIRLLVSDLAMTSTPCH